MASENPMGPTYLPSRFMRYVLTTRNQEELGIAGRLNEIIDWEPERPKEIPDNPDQKYRKIPGTSDDHDGLFAGNRDGYAFELVEAKAKTQDKDGNDRWIRPTGFSLNSVKYGQYPAGEPSAREKGWYAYINRGEPLIEERSDLILPRPDVISEQIYVNRTDPDPMRWTNSVEFSIENEFHWELQGSVELTFEDMVEGTLEQAIEATKEFAAESKVGVEHINHAHKDDEGTEDKARAEHSASEKDSTTSTSTGSGTGEVSADLKLALMGKVSGTLTTGWKQTSTLSGDVASRVVVRATQRRQTRRYDYTIPIVFSGYVALYYPEPVDLSSIGDGNTGYDGISLTKDWNTRKAIQKPDQKATNDPNGDAETDDSAAPYGQVAVFDIRILGLVPYGENYDQKGWAEVVSTLAGQHEAFELEKLTLAGSAGSANNEELLYKHKYKNV
ncbi:Uncharacterised protein [Mycobacteroides abscessus subsp. bolletii]|uniref:hypothetical protein n=1 Tax=Mycobacteroides abscessus TaxID=36809 RepID=UPI0009D47FA4|nr:hypothetical protein [Mycobacteroides abscessus]SLI26688.1 Uncharacterised protein [Mycobacteroides abscessus subsp. bolletii]